VSIPKYHQVGEVERPSILRLDFTEDPKKHVVLLDVQQRQPEEFFASLKAKVGQSKSKEAMVFVHGYNVTFEAAARRTAQLAYDLKFDGPPIFFSWPSQGGLLQYAVDETNVVWSTPHLKDFLASVARQSGAKSVHLIAHSMGNRALTSALVSLAHQLKGAGPMFREVVLTAPDIDADVFKRDIAPLITRTAHRVTLYASSNDEALALSKRLHGYARAGDSGAELVVLNGLDTIDVSNVDTSLLGHSYYGSNDTVLTDMFYILTEPKPASERRWLARVSLGRLTYWVFQRAAANVREATTQEKAIR
jgi:esterase/lipase superfamily enzyme